MGDPSSGCRQVQYGLRALLAGFALVLGSCFTPFCLAVFSFSVLSCCEDVLCLVLRRVRVDMTVRNELAWEIFIGDPHDDIPCQWALFMEKRPISGQVRELRCSSRS